MNQLTGYRLLLLLLGVTLATTAAHAAEKHKIVTERSAAVGDIYRIQIEASGNEASSSTLEGQKVGSETKTLAAKLTAVVEVLSLHDDESVQSVGIKFEGFEGKHNGKPVEIDTSKELIATSSADGNSYSYQDGKTIEQENTIELLNLVTNYLLGDGVVEEEGEDPADEELFNLQEPKAVGTSWSCNNELMAADLSEEGVVADPEKMKSQVSFLAIENYNELKCAKLAVSVDFGAIDIPELRKQGFKIDKSSMKLTLKGLVPLDPEVNDGTFNLEVRMVLSAGANIEQGNLRLNIETGHTVSMKYLPLK
jgi:hypothetical protein